MEKSIQKKHDPVKAVEFTLNELLQHRMEARSVLIKKNGSKTLLAGVRKDIAMINRVLEDLKNDPEGTTKIFVDAIHSAEGPLGR